MVSGKSLVWASFLPITFVVSLVLLVDIVLNFVRIEGMRDNVNRLALSAIIVFCGHCGIHSAFAIYEATEPQGSNAQCRWVYALLTAMYTLGKGMALTFLMLRAVWAFRSSMFEYSQSTIYQILTGVVLSHLLSGVLLIWRDWSLIFYDSDSLICIWSVADVRRYPFGPSRDFSERLEESANEKNDNLLWIGLTLSFTVALDIFWNTVAVWLMVSRLLELAQNSSKARSGDKLRFSTTRTISMHQLDLPSPVFSPQSTISHLNSHNGDDNVHDEDNEQGFNDAPQFCDEVSQTPAPPLTELTSNQSNNMRTPVPSGPSRLSSLLKGVSAPDACPESPKTPLATNSGDERPALQFDDKSNSVARPMSPNMGSLSSVGKKRSEKHIVVTHGLKASRTADILTFHRLTCEENNLFFLSNKLVILLGVICLSTVVSSALLWWFVSSRLRALDSMVKLVCVWLSFSFSEHWWWDFLGGQQCSVFCFPLLKSVALTCCTSSLEKSRIKRKNSAKMTLSYGHSSNSVPSKGPTQAGFMVGGTEKNKHLPKNQTVELKPGSKSTNEVNSHSVQNSGQNQVVNVKQLNSGLCLCQSQRWAEHRRVYDLCSAEYKLLIDQEKERVALAKKLLQLGHGQELDFKLVIHEMKKHVRGNSDIIPTFEVIKHKSTVESGTRRFSINIGSNHSSVEMGHDVSVDFRSDPNSGNNSVNEHEIVAEIIDDVYVQ